MTTKERPILFSCDMVRAILDGRKTQTRRPIKPQPPSYIDGLHGNKLRQRAPYRLEHPETGAIIGSGFFDDDDRAYKCPFGVPGELLWVRETWGDRADYSELAACRTDRVYYAADGKKSGWKYRPSIHMPRWASRITLEAVSVRVERLQEITEEDAQAEGVEPAERHCESCGWTGRWDDAPFVSEDNAPCPECHRDTDSIDQDAMFRRGFSNLWHSIYGRESWAANPWVWSVEFRRVNP